MTQSIYIDAVGSVYLDAGSNGAQPDLKDRVQESCRGRYRRIDRFTQLALLGAAECAGSKTLDSQTSLYIATGKGSAGLQIKMQESIVADREPAKPIQFINAVSNSVNFYVMQELGLNGQSLLVSRELHAFEAVLSLLGTDPALLSDSTAILGMVDEITHPLKDQRARLSLPDDTAMGEGSHWFLCAAQKSEHTLATLTENHMFANLAQAIAWLDSLSKQTELYFGHGLTTEEQEQCMRAAATGSTQLQTAEQYWDGRTAGAIMAYMQQPRRPQLVTLSSDGEGRCHTLRLECE